MLIILLLLLIPFSTNVECSANMIDAAQQTSAGITFQKELEDLKEELLAIQQLINTTKKESALLEQERNDLHAALNKNENSEPCISRGPFQEDRSRSDKKVKQLKTTLDHCKMRLVELEEKMDQVQKQIEAFKQKSKQ